MLTSINPLVERTRSNRWSITAIYFFVGSLVGGAVLGLTSGALGQLANADDYRTPFAVSIVAVSAISLLHEANVTLPLRWWHRQVNENWLSSYRSWVYGAGFGIQLGLGFATYVVTGLVVIVVFASAATGDALTGLAIGAVFGAVRGMSILVGLNVDTPAQLRSRMAAIERLATPARFLSALALTTIGIAVAINAT